MVAIIPKKSDQVTIIGQGFVGLPMAIAIARIKVNNNFLFKVEGIEKNDKRGRELKKKVDNHILPISSKDIFLKKEFQKVVNKNYFLNLSLDNLKKSDVIIISVGFDFSKRNNQKLYTHEFIKTFTEFLKYTQQDFVFASALPPHPLSAVKSSTSSSFVGRPASQPPHMSSCSPCATAELP
jgi:UDP-glucose 6-dehydrogenase